ncbi:DUF3368 domain-containing protein [Methanofollis formosanus]|uniref:DUF3368 domain-containing protein n=1 Tax=Methanofollis formosanus TaxID=299308 RepID=A0A8G0ZZ31_9EURY|nr:hypothetical protein [Methanofollis formosanus]QYZ78230.1 DUF3368 domain-containing protein [Methanofollis formosanus]
MQHTQDLPPACVIDTNVLFDAVAGEYLPDLFRLECIILTTDIAVHEVKTIPFMDLHNLGLKIQDLSGEQILEMVELRERYPALSMEDISVMVLAQHTGAFLLSGDGPLRKAARQEGVTFHGTLWILDNLVARRILLPRRAAEAIEMMQEKGSRLPGEECERRIREWKERR